MIQYEKALEILFASKRLNTVQVPLQKSRGYVSAHTIASGVTIPSFKNSAMDGFAVRSIDLQKATQKKPVVLKMVGSTVAGDTPSAGTGGAWEIMTGAPIPDGYDAVVKIEDVLINGDEVSFQQSTTVKNNVRNAGEDFTDRDIIIHKSQTITPMHIMALATTGQNTIEVTSKPRITVFSTGKELTDDTDTDLLPGQIRNSNSPYLIAALNEMDLDAEYGGIIHDDPELFEQRVTEASKSNDMIISTGAVSAGKHDFIPDSLRKLGAEILFHKVKIRPGKPILYARFPDGTHYFGLPGNPVSAAVGLRFFTTPLLHYLQNMNIEPTLTAELKTAYTKKQGFRFFLKANMTVNECGKLQVEILQGQESFKIHPLLQANCWAVLNENHSNPKMNDKIKVYPFSPNEWQLKDIHDRTN